MKRLIILVIAIGACAVVDVGGTGDRSDVRETRLDDVSPAPSEAQVAPPESLLTCNGSPGQWPGCRGNGCAVCAELVGNAPCYFINHPACVPNTTCNGLYFPCNDACPQPDSFDFDCTERCGNGHCRSGETCASCPADCGSCCGNGVCDNGETCPTCPGDCGGAGSGTCDDGSPCCGLPCQDGSFCK